MHPIIDKLKQRKLVQWGLAYGAGAVALYSALDAFAEPWGVGSLQLRIAQVVLLVGFFLALTVAWYHGERGEQVISGVELLILAGIMGLGAIGIRIVWDTPTDAGSRFASEAATTTMRIRMAGLGENQAMVGDIEVGPAGTGVLYHDRAGAVWYRPWASLTPQRVPWSGVAYWGSPDMEFIVESSPGEIRVVPLNGDPAIRLDVEGVPMAAVAGGDGFIYLTGPDSTIHRVPEDLSAPPESLGIPREGAEVQQRFVPIPRSDAGVFNGLGGIHAFDRRSGMRKRLVEGVRPFPTRTGHLVWATGRGEIMAAALDSKSLELGPPVVLVEGMAMVSGNSPAYSLSTDGTLVYTDGRAKTSEFVWVTRGGESTPAIRDGQFNAGPGAPSWALSADGSKLAHSVEADGAVGIRIVDFSSGSSWLQRSSDSHEREPGWLDDDTILFWSAREIGRYRQWRVNAHGAGEPELALDPSRSVTRGIVSSNGEWTFMRTSGNRANLGRRDIYVRRNTREGEMEPLLASPEYAESSPSLSPDGTLLAYESNESGRYEVYVRPFPDVAAGRASISIDGGTTPQWSRDGSELFYVNSERQMVAAKLTEASLRVEAREILFDIRDDIDVGADGRYSVGRDGRFLMLRERREVQGLVLVQNWFEELQRLVPN